MSQDEQEIRNLVAMWMVATKSGDMEAVMNLMTEDVVFLRVGHPPIIGKAAFAAAAGPTPPNAPQFNGASEIHEINVLGDHAYMWTKLKVVLTPLGSGSITRSGHTLSILRKEQGRWLLARDANMLSAN